jgi:apurinic endonuclease APN1
VPPPYTLGDIRARIGDGARGLQILIENTAGQGGQIGRSFAEVAEIVDRCPDLPMGMCLDTAHSFAAGYDWRDEQASDAAFQDLDRMVGFDRIRVVHFNDSKAAFQSRVDRHWHLGTGEIGPAGLARILNHPRLADVPSSSRRRRTNPVTTCAICRRPIARRLTVPARSQRRWAALISSRFISTAR